MEQREPTTVSNTHVEDLCVGGVVVLLNDMAKLTLSDADLTVLHMPFPDECCKNR